MKRVLAVCALGLLAACGRPAPAPEGGLLDATGVAAPATPGVRIVSLAPSLTQTLSELGQEARLVGVTEYCRPERTDIARIGGMVNPGIEAVVALRPDLVFASIEDNRADDVNRLRRLGLPVFVFSRNDNLAAIERHCEEMGRLLGCETGARSLRAEFARQRAALLADSVSGAPRIFLQLGVEPLVTIGRTSFLNDLLADAGGENLTADLAVYYPRISKEEVVRRNPDVIIAVTMGEASAAVKRQWQPFASVNAVREGRIHAVDADVLCRPTLGAYLFALRTVEALLKGEDDGP